MRIEFWRVEGDRLGHARDAIEGFASIEVITGADILKIVSGARFSRVGSGGYCYHCLTAQDIDDYLASINKEGER